MIKYIVHPGYVTSRSDGDKHYISAGQLMKLYAVKLSECIIITSESDKYKLRGLNRDLVSLFPREGGNYKKYNHQINSD